MRLERSAAAPLGLTVIVALYMAHALPLYFYNVAVPAILRSQGVDLRWIGMLSLLYLPWAFKFLWAPLVDRWHLPRIGRRRSWLWLTQLLLLAGILALAATGLDHGLGVFLAVGLWISTVAATQDIAIDGYTVEALAPAEHRLGSMAQSVGVALGSMVGGAGVLWLYETRGWNVALLTLAAMSALTLLAVQAVQEQPRPAEQQRPSVLRALRRPSMRWALLLIVLYRLVEAPAMAMINPLLVDQQWSLTDIGLLISVTGAGIGMLAAVAAAWLLKRRSAEQLLMHVGIWRSVLYVLLAALLYGGVLAGSWWGLGALVVAMLALRYVAMTSLYALFMRVSSREQAGTDFTLLVCFELLLFFIGGAASGFLAKGLGYAPYYLLLAAVSAIGLLLCRPVMTRLAAPSPSP
ncbi:MFS transporter [Stenotrophomonas sp. ATCM1_4]|uniref:MFS transporter n=1 Tax=Stenotrophomonas sp. ATCM1_4 TaxID=2259330 RepID=UPI0010430072|nr:MFS transporter [Stenotrophomonas sp. ATCM1_4]TDB26269.1 MFS transporter [Stenotrophomonas sp. ATCM1_4]